MTNVRLGYVAMSVNVQNCSPSQTMTHTQFSKINDRDAAIGKLERIAQSNAENCLRLLKYNYFEDIRLFRLSSKLVPLATHADLKDWDYMDNLNKYLAQIGAFAKKHDMRIDFHPDHFVQLNSKKPEGFKLTMEILDYHYRLLKGMKIDPTHRCVVHIGGGHQDKATALEQFVRNWANIPEHIQKMIILENDDKIFNVQDALYLCEKLNIPLVFDYHHHLVNHAEEEFSDDWERVKKTWEHSQLPIKVHISSPKSDKQFRAHADHILPSMFLRFVHTIKDTVPEIDCMIEAKKKDEALFKLMNEIKQYPHIEIMDKASFGIS